jgi:septum formation protein
MRLILASSSPRRRELLRAAGFSFDVISPDTDESLNPDEAPKAAVVRLAEEKARAVQAKEPDAVILAADTAVVLDGQMLGKPSDEEEARRMLRALSNREHEVVTGFAILTKDAGHSSAAVTRVQFRKLSESEIDDYIASGEPMDKAGAYGIQSGAAHFVRSIHGSYTNVVGLPMAEVVEGLSLIRVELAEDALDLAAFDARANEPTVDFEAFVQTLKRDGTI